VASPLRSAWLADTVTRRIRSEVTLKGGSLLTERPLEHFSFYSQASIKVSCMDAYTIRVQPAGNGS